jgi:hypothetical protein
MVEGYRRRSEKGNRINLDEYSGGTGGPSVRQVLSECFTSFLEGHEFHSNLMGVFFRTPSIDSLTVNLHRGKMIRICWHGKMYLQRSVGIRIRSATIEVGKQGVNRLPTTVQS